ncbi:MAG TPA: SMC-Scp complex subunit ScpB [Polyangia bacterium]|jgi:segregation and condensation protein B|nr:SMC-Scp complex subunit ScpB [Polyangia bacterium]
MSKRKKTNEPAAEDAVTTGVVTTAVEGDLTSPDLSGPEAAFDGPDPDTQVGPAPTTDSWDGPTNVGTEDELAELAAASVSPVGDVAPLPEGTDEAAPEPPPEVAPGRLASIIESLLFASDRPLTLSELKRLVGERDGGKLTAALEELRARREETGVQVIQAAGGWHLRTNPENVAWVSRVLAGKPPRLSRAMLETLAIVAYRQPITRPEIDEIRGVDCGPVLKTLLERGLVRMIGKKEEVGRPILYGTTPEFLRTFSLRDLNELPTLREFHELGEAEMAKVDAAAPVVAAPAADAPPKPPAIRELDPEEEDELLTELDRASAAASQAAAPPAAATIDAPATTVGTDDETVG